MFAALAVTLLLAAGLLLAGCPASDQDQNGDEGTTPETPTNPVYRTDKGYLSITVTSPPYLYLSGPEPLVVKLPQTDAFVWESNQAKMTTVSFPLLIPFEVPKTAPGGGQELTLGLRLTYCNKADDVCVFKNDLVSVPVDVMPGLRPAGQEEKPIVPVVYEIKEPERKQEQNG